MKSLIYTLFLLGITMNIFAQEETPRGADLTVHVVNIESEEGMVILGLYDSKGNWLKKNIVGKKEKIKDSSCTSVFENLIPGMYAVSIYHDKNSNNKLDTGLFGIPKEPYASSRGAKGRFGPPKWKDAVFEITGENKTIEIKF